MKITTSDIKKMISEWLGKVDLSTEFIPNVSEREDLDREAEYFNLPKGLTHEEIGAHKLKLFINGNQWLRDEKHRLGDDTYGWIWFHVYEDGNLKFYPDHDNMFGYDEKYAKELHTAGKLNKCWHRDFYPKSELRDNYSLKVLTNPEDTKVIAWQVMTD